MKNIINLLAEYFQIMEVYRFAVVAKFLTLRMLSASKFHHVFIIFLKQRTWQPHIQHLP
jgi:hypothetical protein